MHPRGLLPHRLILAGLALSALSACASPRYVGSIGRNDVYSNRGFGVLVDLSKGGVLARWRAIDPDNATDVPARVRPKRVRAPLDLDGDGLLEVSEATVFYEPTLRLVSKTSSVAKMDLEVQILGKNNLSAPLVGILGAALNRYTETSSAARKQAFSSIQMVEIAGTPEARVAEVKTPPRAARLMIADVPDFVAEEKQTRRHVVRFTLTAPEIDDQMRADFDALVSGMVLAPKGAAESNRERW